MLRLLFAKAVFVALVCDSSLGLQATQGNQVLSAQPPPYQISLAFYNEQNNTYKHWCSGSIISNKWIVTAGSCFDKREWPNKNASLVILTGTDQLDSSVKRSHQTINEPNYYWWYYMNKQLNIAVNDIILVSVAKPFEFGANLQPVQLYNQDEETVAESSAILSGRLSSGESQNPQNFELTIMSKYQCNIVLHGGLTYTGQICAAYQGNENTPCSIRAEPGSPLIVNGRLAGILSWGSDPCASPDEASIYTEVGYFRNWIKNETGV